MQKVRCYDCGRSYDYDEDGFCPNCGAFNPPRRSLRIGADGSVVRVDGINEANHTDSFVHQEFHEEKQERRRIGLDKSVRRVRQTADAVKAPPAGTPLQARQRDRRQSQRQEKNPLGIAVWIIILIILINLLPRILFFL